MSFTVPAAVRIALLTNMQSLLPYRPMAVRALMPQTAPCRKSDVVMFRTLGLNSRTRPTCWIASLFMDCETAPVGSGSFIVGSALLRKWREKNSVRIDSRPRPQHSWHQALR